MITGNKGEWSELYVLLKLLADGILYSADENAQLITDAYLPIESIFRNEDLGRVIYDIPSDDPDIHLYINDVPICTIPRTQLANDAKTIFSGITNSHGNSFEIRGARSIMDRLHTTRLKAANTTKADIEMRVTDSRTGLSLPCGFSIKSELGHSPTLLNASRATNFVFEVIGLKTPSIDDVNRIDGSGKIIKRMEYIYGNGGQLRFLHAENTTFSDNLTYIGDNMELLLAYALEYSYRTNICSCVDIVDYLSIANPLGYRNTDLYAYRMKKFLCAIALGMMPATPWNGLDEATGGYIIVRSDGNVVAYHIYHRDNFEEYLLRNTRFERGSSTRHGFASLYRSNGKLLFNLNLQLTLS